MVLGHVDARTLPRGKAVFYELGRARRGDKVDVTRADRTVAQFTVDTVVLVDKADFPTEAVYGRTHVPVLRLITCGGRYTRTGGYSGNVIVFAHYTGHRLR